MLGKMANIFKIPDLRRKILVTLGLLAVYRIGAHIPTPYIDSDAVAEFWNRSMTGQRGILSMVDMFSGGGFRQMTVFALGIMPYISASIILQLLMVVWPRLEKIAKEGAAGAKKINQYTRYGTVLLSAFQSLGLSLFLLRNGLAAIPEHRLAFMLITMLAMTTGTAFIMWLGEKISEFGIGNGISLIIAAGIMAQYPISVILGISQVQAGILRPIWPVAILAVCIVSSWWIIRFQEGSRKIPIQHAKRVVGRRVMSGGTNYLPLKVNTAGVIPVIFSSSILMFPSIIFSWFGGGGTSGGGGFFYNLGRFFDISSPYNLYSAFNVQREGIFLLLKVANMHSFLYILLTMFFCYFYTAITFNPIDTAENLKKYGAFVPGRRPGKNTADYIDFVLTRITLVGGIFLVCVAMLPQIISVSFNVPWQLSDLTGGTGLIIVVGVLLDTMKQIESQLLMRHYDGFKIRARTARWSVRAR
ncbi:MAG: preprotein translocase subunit SecY [bacterium]